MTRGGLSDPARRRPGACRGRDDVGSASIWMLGFAMVLWVTVAAVVVAGSAMVARHRAATAADLSALAGAAAVGPAMPQVAQSQPQPLPLLPPDPGRLTSIACAAASASAVANHARLTRCAVDGTGAGGTGAGGMVVGVEVAVAVPGLARLGRLARHNGLGVGTVSAQARAGPS